MIHALVEMNLADRQHKCCREIGPTLHQIGPPEVALGFPLPQFAADPDPTVVKGQPRAERS